MPDWQTIMTHIQDAIGQPVSDGNVQSVGGGCINTAYALHSEHSSFFVKINLADSLTMFEAEADGLREISRTGTIAVPEPLCNGIAGSDAFLVMEFLSLGGQGRPEQMGEQLAALHRTRQSRFGWYRNNTIGSTLQINQQEDDWVAFWSRHRLGFQLALAKQKGAGKNLLDQGEQLLEGLRGFFTDYQPVPSLLHGDLWSGNYAYQANGQPVIFDPAVYYGDRETDIAMTELFGGFPKGFYDAYNADFPLDSGYRVRKQLYNLYHIINHYNLFGGGYLAQAGNMVERLLAELG